MFGNFTWILLWAVLPTLVYLGIGLYILSLEQKKGPGYKLPALIYFISVPSIIVIVIVLNFTMNYESGRFESTHKPVGYELYKFLVLKDIIPRSGQNLEAKDLINDEEISILWNAKLNKFKEVDFKETYDLDLDFNIDFSRLGYNYYNAPNDEKILSFKTKKGILNKGVHDVDVYLNEVEYVQDTELFKFKFIITSASGEVSKVKLNILKNYPENFSLNIEESGIKFGRLDFEDHLGKIHSIHSRNSYAKNIFAYFHDIEKTNKPSLVAGLSPNMNDEFEIDEVIDDYYKEDKELNFYQSIKNNKFPDDLFNLILEENDTLYAIDKNENYGGACFNENLQKEFIRKCGSALSAKSAWRHYYDVYFSENIFDPFKKALEKKYANVQITNKINNSEIRNNILSLVDKHHKNKFKGQKKYILGENKNVYEKLNIKIDDYINIFPDNTITLSFNLHNDKYGEIEKERNIVVFQETDLLNNHLSAFITYKNTKYLKTLFVVGTDYSFKEEINIPEFIDIEKEYSLPEIIKQKVNKQRSFSRFNFEFSNKRYKVYLVDEGMNKTFLALYGRKNETSSSLDKLLTSTIVDNNYFFKDYNPKCDYKDENNCKEYSDIIINGLSDFDYQPNINNAKKIINKISFNEEINFSDNRMLFADSKTKEIAKIENKLDERLITNEKYYALVIGNNNYQYLEKLDAAENDAKVIADILENKYGFEVELLLNGDYSTTVNSIFNMTKKLKENDNLLIYYAGHGELDKSENRGYWLPVNASTKSRAEWISNQRIVDRVKATKAKHVLLMVDSCFSGSLMRGGELSEENETIDKKYIERLKKKKTRLVITSGGNEPVVDSDGGNHSLFALKLIDTLKNNDNVINSQILFENIRRYVVANADQTPERAMVHKTGHDGGDFLFFPK